MPVKAAPYLKKKDIIAITCPAGYMPYEKAATCIETLNTWGFQVLVGKTLGSASENYFSGTDQERLDELQAMLDAPEIKAILFGRGGYGTGRIIDRLDFKAFKKNPKWLIGFSDISILHTHIQKQFNISTIHGPMAAAFSDPDMHESILSLKNALLGKKIKYKVQAHPFNQAGKARGQLIGGNLAMLTHVIGTSSDFSTKGKILFIEDVGEYGYQVDRMMYQLSRSGKLKGLAGLLIGGFTDMKDTTRPFGQTVYEMIRDLVQHEKYPVCFGFPVSHGQENKALKNGFVYSLTVEKKAVNFRED